MVKYIKHQISLFRWLTYIQVCRHYIVEDNTTHQLSIRKTEKIWILFYYLIWINTTVKVIYLFMTYQGWLLEVEFLDKMSIWVYFLMLMEMAQETITFCKKTPLCEILLANWRLQREIFLKLNRPEEVEEKIMANDKLLVRIHAVIVLFGCGSLMVQFYPAPKYALYTYAIFPYENDLLKLLFAMHEFIFMWHAWVNAAGAIVLCEIFAVSNTHHLQELAKIAESLYQPQNLTEAAKLPKITLPTTPPPPVNIPEDNSTKIKQLSVPMEPLQPTQIQVTPIPKILNSLENVETSNELIYQYEIEALLFDYKKLMLATNQFDNWAGKWMGGTVGVLYLQFVMDVFIMIQLLKEPGTDFLAVSFFFQDACVGMFMMFRLLILLSRVYPASNEFLHQIKTYLRIEMPSKQRKYLIKYQNTFKPVAAKLAGYTTTPKTVPIGIHALINYYISAAMWKTPMDA